MPTNEEIKSAKQKLYYRLKQNNFPKFKINREDASTEQKAKSILYRNEYSEAENIFILYDGSKGKCWMMELILIYYSLSNYPKLCLNKSIGGGPRGIIEIGIYKLLSQTNFLDFQKLLWYIKV